MDSDGCMEKDRGRAVFANTNIDLADAVSELATSLGETTNRQTRDCAGFGSVVTAYRVSWQPLLAPVTLSRKVERFRPRKILPYRGVASIEKVPSVPTRCIAVESPTRTYLAGRSMVVTHNTVIRRLFKYLPVSIELQTAVALDERGDAGLSQMLDDVGAIDSTATELAESGAQQQLEHRDGGDADGETDTVSFAQVADAIKAATTVDELDVAVDLIRGVADERQRAELDIEARARRKALS
jgi:hypothetical protein